uniref:hypothetical protein n=1 Tax=Crenothrix polyspora TaxID=360316 RepID=UPI001178AEB4
MRRLAETGCEVEIDALINWMVKDYVGAFGSHKYPFYNLHARQYLLIAIAHAAIDVPQIFQKHYAIFAQHALDGIPHALIQKFAADIALVIEAAFPNTYNSETIEKLSQIGVSQFLIQEIEGYGNHFESPWHKRGEVDRSLQIHFSYDFDRYWFEPLGNVFGITAQQVEDLARVSLLKDWGIQMEDQYVHDPRENLWRNDR